MKKLIVILCSVLMVITMCSCASVSRDITDMKSDFGRGLHRTIKVYTADGRLMAEYEGKIDIAPSEGGYVKFDYNGKRYIYYNCFVETIADI